MKALLILIPAILLSACSGTIPVIKTETVYVNVKVPVPCNVESPPPPAFNFDKLTKADDLSTKAKSLLADRHLHLAYEQELVVALESCRNLPK